MGVVYNGRRARILWKSELELSRPHPQTPCRRYARRNTSEPTSGLLWCRHRGTEGRRKLVELCR